MASTSSTPHRKINYDVFLSFRGTDTRKTFVNHLYNRLQTNIRVFIDDGLEKGKRIEELLQIIKESRFAIVVFSKDYASSKWCLEEIATIMECQQQYGEEIMIPIFYDVEPTIVRNQTESFAYSFKKHEEENTEKAKVERWKNALKAACAHSGHDLKNQYNGYEGNCVDRVNNDILTRMNLSIQASTNNFMGLESRVADVSNLLRQETDKVQFIGIWGMDGIGKKTIAMTVFNKLKSSRQFDEACFLDVNKQNIIELQVTLLKTIVKMEMKINNEAEGMVQLENWLKGKNVLIVLENVVEVEQLEKLVGGRNWFGRDSRVIITTRDKKVLVSHKVDEKYIYKVNEWDDQEALELFCWYAFDMKIPKTGFEELCGSIVPYAMGLPLALKHLGNYLCRQDSVKWGDTLEELKDTDTIHTPKDKILAVLKKSYDGLNCNDKNVFLHIACFFRNWREEYVKKVLDRNSLDVLIEKSLISVQNGKIEMHDLIQEMGWHIARKEEPRRRIWQLKEVQDVLLCRRMDHHQYIEGISWWGWLHKNMSRTRWLHKNMSSTFKITFSGMTNLKMLKAGGANDSDYRVKDNYIPSSLRWLEYEFYNFKSLPESFESSMLVGLSLRKSSLLNCDFTEELDKLTILDLSCSMSLLETPDFDKMPNLKRINLSYCKKLKSIHSSIGNLRQLICLNLRACSNLKKLPSFNHVSALEFLDLALCKKLKKFPEIKAETSCLVKLDLREVGIIVVPPSIQQLHALTKLSLDDCEHLKSLPNDLCELKNLKILTIRNCKNLKSLPENLEGLISLEYLNLQRSHFDSLPQSFSQLTSLQYLDITECQNPNQLPKLPANIRELYADCRFKIALAIECSKLYSVSYSDDDNPQVGTFLSEEFIHRETPLHVSYLITAPAEDNILNMNQMNQMLRSFKYRHYQSNGISIHLNSSWYSQKFVGFVVCFLRLKGDIWGPHSYQDIDHSMKHCTVIVKFSHKGGEEVALQKNCVIAGLLAGENDDARGHVCFAFIPFRSLWGESKAPKDYSRFEVQFMNVKASADWGCSLLYQRQTGASEHRSRHNGSDSGLTTDDIACLTLLELERTEYLNLNRLKSAHLLENYTQLPHLRYIDISGCRTLTMLPKFPPTIRELYAHSNLASESKIAKLAIEYSELYSVSFSHGDNIAELNLSPEKLARMFIQLPSQIRNSPLVVTYPTLTDIDTKRWFKYSSHSSNKVSIKLNSSWYSQTFVGFVVHYLLKGRLHKWESQPKICPFRRCKVIAKLIHKDNANEVLQTNCVIGRLYDEEFDFNKDDIICVAYIPFCSLSCDSPNDYSKFEVAFLDSNNLSDWSCGLLYENGESSSEAIRSNASSSYNNDLAGCTTDISGLCHRQYLADISGREGIIELPELPATIKELYAAYNKSLASESNIVDLVNKYSELHSVSFGLSYPVRDKANLVPRDLAEKFIPIRRPLLNRNAPFAVTYPLEPYTDYKISGCFKYPHDPHQNPHMISIFLDPTWYNHNFVGFVVCFVFPKKVRWESRHNHHFRYCELITKLIHKDHGSEPPLQTNCVIGRPCDEESDNNIQELVCFAYIPFSSLWPTYKTITDNIKPNHYLVFEATIQDLKMSRISTIRCPNSKALKDKTTANWSCGLLYTDDESLTEAIRRKRDVGSFYPEPGSNKSDLDEEAPITEHSIEEASMAFTQPGAIIGENIQSDDNNPIDELEIVKQPHHSNIRRRKMADDHKYIERSGGDDAMTEDSSNSGLDITKSWELTEIMHPVQCRMVSMPECSNAKVVRLLYTNSGASILALNSDGIQKLWKWSNEQNPSGKATANSVPQHWQPNSGLLMINDVLGLNLEKVVPCIDLWNDDSRVVSAAGGMVSLFNINTFKVLTTFRPPSTPTFLVLHPRNNDIIAIGTEDATIYIYDGRVDEAKIELFKGHHKHITGLAFSTIDRNMLVSSSADAQLCVWNNIFGRWQNRRSVRIQSPAGEVHSGDTHVMFHTDQLHLLVTHETQLAIYDTSNMERIRQWIPQGCLSAPISSATYSCNSQLVYASFIDGNIGVLDADNLTLRCRFAPSAYLSQLISNRSLGVGVDPLVIAAHPHEPYQIAVGLTDGSIKVIEPLESIGNWEVSSAINNEILNGKEGEEEERGESLDVEEYEAKESNAGHGVEVAMSEHNDSEKSVTDAALFKEIHAFTQPNSIIGEEIEGDNNHHIEEDYETTASQQELGQNRTNLREFIEIVDPVECRMVSMPECSDAKVVGLLYTNSGVGILALSSDGIQKLWKWPNNEQNPTGKATANCVPQHWQPNSGLLMINDVVGEKVVPCIALSNDDSYVVSTAGGKVSLFNIMTFEVTKTITPLLPSASTFLAFDPHDNNIIVIGTEKSTIYIYDRTDEELNELGEHHKPITGLAFSTDLKLLVSSDADAQLCSWNTRIWKKKRSVRIQLPAGEVCSGDTHVMFHVNQLHLLVTHETQLAIYDASKMERINQWIPHASISARISSATYSCDSRLVYASFIDGNIVVLDADTLRPRCCIASSAYLSQGISNGSLQGVYPTVISAHPQEPNQLAIGLTNGSVKVIEPMESVGNWEVTPSPIDNEILNGRLAEQPLAQPPATMCRLTKLRDEIHCILILMLFLCGYFAYKHIRIILDTSYQGVVDEMHCVLMLAAFFCIFIGMGFRLLLVFSRG